MTEEDEFFFEEDKLGMKVTSGVVKIDKDENNLIGISIGGGAPNCPCLYVVQVFDDTPASSEGTLESGDEIVTVNGISMKGKTKVEVAKMIQSVKSQVIINYNKLHADPKQGKSLDIILKKVKHRMVENMSSATADALGLSRAILCNDSLLKKLEELEKMESMYRGIIDYTISLLKGHLDICQVYKAFGDVFAEIGVREPNPSASEDFSKFGETHRSIEKQSIEMVQTIKPVLSDLHTFLYKAVPDTKLTIKKYADVKFEYLSYCLKVKEMDDEEYQYQTLQEPLYRIETGNYEYRLVLRCRQDARRRFGKLRSDVLEKLELLDQKHVQDIANQLQRLISSFAKLHVECHSLIKENLISPIEIDLSHTCTFTYPDLGVSPYQYDAEEEEEEGEEAIPELLGGLTLTTDNQVDSRPAKQFNDSIDLLGID
ncbi:PRKCA-binding protein-like [Panonychus citri]|uniref:PRKCA-binding protein-like n=1 Tax=Panonychus citri TaxID=50023 RepID=UPI002307762B|nr:PRKCA-binding protein-like [Panonychus citri]